MDRTLVEVQLPNGVTALVHAVDAGGGAGAAKAAIVAKHDLSAVMGTLEGMSLAVKSALAKARPDKVSVEFGLELAVKAGTLTAMLVDGGGTASLRVTLEWQAGDESVTSGRSGKPDADGP